MFRTFGSTFTRGLAATIVSATLSFAVIGCSSTDNTPTDGSATTDTGSTTACTETQVMAIFNAPAHACGTCHTNDGSGAMLDTMSPGLGARLLNVTAPGGGTTWPSVCGGRGLVYLTPHSNPATGFFIDKLTATPGCGVEMPYVGTHLTATELACVKSWATTVTSP